MIRRIVYLLPNWLYGLFTKRSLCNECGFWHEDRGFAVRSREEAGEELKALMKRLDIQLFIPWNLCFIETSIRMLEYNEDEVID